MNNLISIKKSKKARIITNAVVPFFICILVVALASFIGGCKNKTPEDSQEAAQAETTATQTAATTAESTTAAQTESATESIEEITTESSEEVPVEILDLIEKADSYYLSGDYGLARSTYRKSEIAINDSDLSDGKKKELIDSFYPKYEKAKDIIDSASMRYASAMQLIYETRYEEAKSELESALALYPKYAEAQEAYDNLKTLMGLQ